MVYCSQCRNPIAGGEQMSLHGEILCDDCYIDRLWPKNRKTYYEFDDTEFMRRLKKSCSVRPQRFH
jgi:hypothetical protein